MDSYDLLFIILNTSAALIAACTLYIAYVVMIVTPRVDRLNNIIPYWTFNLSASQAGIYIWCFHPIPFLKNLPYFKKHLGMYKASPRDILHFKIYKYVLYLSGPLMIFFGFLVMYMSKGL